MLYTVDVHLHCFQGLWKPTVEGLWSAFRVGRISVFKVEELLDVVLLVEANLLQVFSNKLLFFFQVLVVYLDLLQLQHLFHFILFSTLEAILEVLQLGVGLQICLDHSLNIHGHSFKMILLIELIILLLMLNVVLELSHDREVCLILHLRWSVVAAASAREDTRIFLHSRATFHGL